ncbi:MAG: recombinase family protein [Ruminococcus sp.]|nr:recombinase family protein [Ruminococcus sp.]
MQPVKRHIHIIFVGKRGINIILNCVPFFLACRRNKIHTATLRYSRLITHSNPLYCGKVGWKTKSNGDTLYKGLHEPIVSEETFNAVQDKKKTNPAAQLHPNDTLLNYYHNILYCKNCGHQLRRRVIANSGHEYMLCTHRECRGKIVSSTIEAVDEAAISAFRYRIKQLEKLKRSGKTEFKNEPEKKAPLIADLEKSKRQLSRLYDLLEQEIYDINTFLERSKVINEKINSLEAAIKEIDSEQKIPQLPPDEAIRRLEYVIGNFANSDPEEKNRLLHTVVRKLYYHKTQKMCRNKTDSDLTLNADFL